MHKTGAVGTAGVFVVLILAGCVGGTQGDVVADQPQGTPIGSTSVATPSNGTPAADAGSIVGHVTDDEMKPLPSATVTIQNLDVRLAVAEDGRFEFLHVAAGRHVVEAQAPGHSGHAIVVHVSPDATVEAAFSLAPLQKSEPRIEVYHRVTVIHWGGAPFGQLWGVVPGTCDDCSWWVPLPDGTERTLIEADGNHSVPNPVAGDGLDLWIRGYAANGSTYKQLHSCPTNPLDPCFRLPQRIAFGPDELRDEDHAVSAVQRLRVNYACDPSWVCLEDRYETWVSAFVDWKGEEVPPDYSARPDG